MAKRFGNGPTGQSGQDIRAVCRYFARNTAIWRRKRDIMGLDQSQVLLASNGSYFALK